MTQINTPPAWLLASEAAEIARVSERTFRCWIALGYVGASKPANGRILVDGGSLHAFLEAGRVRPAAR